MATWKSTPDERAQAAQLVLKKVDNGASLADSIRHFAQVLEVSEDTLRRWVRQEKASAAAAPPVDAAPATEPAARVAPVATAVLERPEPSPAPAPMPSIESLFEATATTQPSRARRTLQRVAIALAGVVAVIVGASFVGTIADSPREKAEKRVADYVAGKGTHEYVATDAHFRASFPFGMPKRESQSRAVGPLNVEFVTYGTEADTGAFAVSSFVLPAGVPYDLNAGVNGAAVAVDGHIESATPTTFVGSPAIEFVLNGTDSGRAFVDKGLIVQVGERIYLLQAIWEDGPAPGYDAFKASFHIEG